MQDAYQHGVSSCIIGVACGRTTMTQPPNILILMTDQQKASCVGSRRRPVHFIAAKGGQAARR